MSPGNKEVVERIAPNIGEGGSGADCEQHPRMKHVGEVQIVGEGSEKQG